MCKYICIYIYIYSASLHILGFLLSPCDAAELTRPLSDKFKRLRLLLPRRLEGLIRG